jgi:Rv0078B-related antitoxin
VKSIHARPLNIEMMDDAMAEVLRAKSPAERLAIADGMWRSAVRMIEAILRAERPDWTDDEIRREIARRMSMEPSDLLRILVRELERLQLEIQRTRLDLAQATPQKTFDTGLAVHWKTSCFPHPRSLLRCLRCLL